MSRAQDALARLRSCQALEPALRAPSALQEEASRLLGKLPAPATALQGSVFPAAWDSTAQGGRFCPFRAAQKHPHMSPSTPAGEVPSALHMALPLQRGPCLTVASFATLPSCPALHLKDSQGACCTGQKRNCKQASCESHLPLCRPHDMAYNHVSAHVQAWLLLSPLLSCSCPARPGHGVPRPQSSPQPASTLC